MSAYGYPIGPQRPVMVVNYPTCSECHVDLMLEGADYWLCAECGSTWPTDAGDGDECDAWDGLS